MKTAQDIIKWAFDNSENNVMVSEIYELALNEARKEALMEAANRVKIIRYNPNPFIDYESGLGSVQRDQIDKQSILQMIDELQ